MVSLLEFHPIKSSNPSCSANDQFLINEWWSSVGISPRTGKKNAGMCTVSGTNTSDRVATSIIYGKRSVSVQVLVTAQINTFLSVRRACSRVCHYIYCCQCVNNVQATCLLQDLYRLTVLAFCTTFRMNVKYCQVRRIQN